MTYVWPCVVVTRGMNVVDSELVIVWNETDMEPSEVGFRDLPRRTADIHEIMQLLLSMSLSRCELTTSVLLYVIKAIRIDFLQRRIHTTRGRCE